MLRWGIVGLGNIAHSFTNDLVLLDGHTLQAVASRSMTKAQAFAEAHNVMSFYDNYNDLFNDQDIDIVYIATPHTSHKELSIDAMALGKHVLCEKPLAVSLCDVDDMIAASKKYNKFLMEAMWSRFNPAIIEVLKIIKNRIIGDVKYINADFCFRRDVDLNHRLFNPNLAGGALLDVGIYPLFLSYLLLGQPHQIKSSCIKHENGIDMQTSMLLDYKDANAVLNCGFLSNADMEARINGTKGSIHIHKRWHESQGYTLIKDKKETSYSIPKIGKGYSHEILECLSCIENGLSESPKWSHNNSLQLMTLMETIRKDNSIVYPFEK